MMQSTDRGMLASYTWGGGGGWGEWGVGAARGGQLGARRGTEGARVPACCPSAPLGPLAGGSAPTRAAHPPALPAACAGPCPCGLRSTPGPAGPCAPGSECCRTWLRLATERRGAAQATPPSCAAPGGGAVLALVGRCRACRWAACVQLGQLLRWRPALQQGIDASSEPARSLSLCGRTVSTGQGIDASRQRGAGCCRAPHCYRPLPLSSELAGRTPASAPPSPGTSGLPSLLARPFLGDVRCSRPPGRSTSLPCECVPGRARGGFVSERGSDGET